MSSGEARFFDCLFNRFTGFASTLLNPIKQFVMLALCELKIVVREHSPPSFQPCL